MNRALIIRAVPINPNPRVERVARWLNQANWHVTAIGWDRHLEMNKMEKTDFGTMIHAQIFSQFNTGVRNFWPLIKWQFWLFGLLMKIGKNYDVIHAIDLDSAVPALIVSRIYHIPFIYDIADFYAESRFMPRFLKTLFRALELKIVNWADAVILADINRKNQIKNSHPKRLEILYNVPEIQDLPSKSINHHNKPKLTITYVGVLSKIRGILQLVKIVKKHQDWLLNLAGFGPEEKFLKSISQKITQIRFYGKIPYSKTIELSHQADVLVATYDPSIPNHRYSSANKLFEAMKLGKPIIVAKNTGMDSIVLKYGLGFIIKYGDIDSLEQALSEVANWDEEKKQNFAQHAKTIYKKFYDSQIMKERCMSIYQNILS